MKRIGEIAHLLGLNPRTIRYYESLGLLPRPARSRVGYRMYGDVERDRLTFIRKARAVGLTLADIREILTLRHTAVWARCGPTQSEACVRGCADQRPGCPSPGTREAECQRLPSPEHGQLHLRHYRAGSRILGAPSGQKEATAPWFTSSPVVRLLERPLTF